MPPTKARIVVCDRRLAPNLPSVIVDIDKHLYIDIDSAARTIESFTEGPSPNWKVNLQLVRWFWNYNQLNAPKYYCPTLQTVLVDWCLSYTVNRRLGYRAAWEVMSEEVFTEATGQKALFLLDFGTYDVSLSAYFTSRHLSLDKKEALEWQNECMKRREEGKFTLDHILSEKLATLDVYETKGEVNDLDYRLYELYERLISFLRRVFQKC